MAGIGNTNLTLLDHAKRLDPNGKIAKIVEQMNNVNEIVDDMVVIPGNTTTGLVTSIRSGLPSVGFRQINKGVLPTKSTVKQVEMTAGMIESQVYVDEVLLNLAEDKGAFRLSEAKPHMEAISQTLASTLFYGNVAVDPEKFTGMTPYFTAYSATKGTAGNQIIKAGGTGSDNTSMWLVGWGDQSVCGFYPKNTQAGIVHEDEGKHLISDSTNGNYFAYVDKYTAKLGLAVKDFRYLVRICNLDISDLATASDSSDTSQNLIKCMIQAMNKMYSLQGIKPVFYCNREVKTALDIKAYNKSNVQLSIQELSNGKLITTFMGIPVKLCEALVNTETLVS